MLATIYGLADQSGPIRYIGLTRDLPRRIKQYKLGGHTRHLDNWLKSVGGRLKVWVIEEVPIERADAEERAWIQALRDGGSDLINYTSGGEGGYALPPAHREKLRATANERIAAGTHNFQNPAIRERQRAGAARANRGPKSPAHAAQLRSRCLAWAEKCRGKKQSPEHVAKVKAAKRRDS